MAHKTWAWYDMDAYLLYMYKMHAMVGAERVILGSCWA